MESFPQAAFRARVAIIIDDLGYSLAPGQVASAIPHALTLAVIPHTPHGAKIAAIGHAAEKEIMLHTPMETLNQQRWEKGLSVEMDELELFASVTSMLLDIPHVKGINNHGGSKFTQDRRRMDWLMTLLSERSLYFIDSRTVHTSQAQIAASAAHVATASRDIFLDNDKNAPKIRDQLEKLRQIALKEGKAIAIGHPYPATLATLVEILPTFARQGIAVVSVSAMLVTSDSHPRKPPLKSP